MTRLPPPTKGCASPSSAGSTYPVLLVGSDMSGYSSRRCGVVFSPCCQLADTRDHGQAVERGQEHGRLTYEALAKTFQIGDLRDHQRLDVARRAMRNRESLI